MLRDVTIGQYYPAESVIHSLDPRVKLVATLIYIITLFAYHGPVALGICALFLIWVVWLSKVPVGYILRGLKTIMVILIITAAINLFLTQGTVTYWSYGFLRITNTGVKTAVTMVIRLIFLIMATSIMTLTTTPNQLTDGLETGLRYFNKIGVPVHEIAMMMSIALRFIPILTEETDKIMKAQMARGADFETGGLIKKTKAMIPLLVPLFVSAFRRANDLAMAMEARCYHGGEGRTKMKPLHYSEDDRDAYIILFLYLLAVILASVVWSQLFAK